MNESVNDSMNEMSNRPSLMIRQSIDDDVLSLIRNTEQRTWDTIDVLKNMIEKQNDKVDAILRHCENKPVVTDNEITKITSPLVESIQIDTINDNVSRLVRNFDSLLENLNTHNSHSQLQLLENEALNAMSDLSHEENSPRLRNSTSNLYVTDMNLHTNNQHVQLCSEDSTHVTGNSIGVSKPSKEAIAHKKVITEKVDAETFKQGQKMRMHNSPADRPGNDMAILDIEKDLVEQINSEKSNLSGDSELAIRSALEQSISSTFLNPLAQTFGFSSTQNVNVRRHFQQINTSAIANLSNGDGIAETIEYLDETEKDELTDLYVSKFSNNTTCDDVLNFLSHHQFSSDMSNIRVHRLTKKNQDVSRLSFVSFKIETNREIGERLLHANFWPKGSYIKEFVRKNSSSENQNRNLNRIHPDLSSCDFLSRETRQNLVT